MTMRVRMEEAAAALAPRLREIRKAKPGATPVFAAVVGGSASGKGHLIAKIVEALDGRAAVLSLDDYYLGAAERSARGAPHFDHPAALDLSQAAAQLARMRMGRKLKIPRYDFSSGERAGEQEFAAKRFVLIDGLFALYAPEIRALADLSIFVESDHYGSMLRRLFRDAGPGGRTQQTSRQVLEQYFTQVWPSKRAFIDPTAQYADVIVESRYDAAAEAGRAGPMQYQLKAKAKHLSDDAVAYLCGATRLGGTFRQVDRFLCRKGSGAQGDILRLRIEPGAGDDEVLFTYKGPLVTTGGIGGRSVTSAVALPREAFRWFGDDYAVEATLEKTRVFYQARGALIARDHVRQLGSYVEVRTADAADIPRLRKMLDKLCPGEPQTDASYLDLWRAGTRPSLSP